MNPDEVRNMDNKNCLIFIKGFNPIFDEKYWPFDHKNFKQTEDGGAKSYTHNIRKSNKIKDGLKIYSEREIKEVEKSGEKVNIIDLTPQEIAALQESEFQMETKPTDEDLREELTTRLCTMDFSAEQMDEAKKALAIRMDLKYLLEYLKPEISIEEMKEKLEKYQSR